MLNHVCSLRVSLGCGFLAVYTDLAGYGDLADTPTYTVSSVVGCT